ncbi:MAG: adenylate kinase [Candidatus Saccharibacteria bacterium]|nr:adenylate kinase [Candidatus Saccharibacteria bacterium]
MIIFMGVAGSGKSLQGRRLADELALPWLSTGEFLRMLVSGERRIAMVEGKLLGDQEIIALVQKILHMIDTNEEFVLDGFPRTVTQADWLLSQIKHGQLKMTGVIHLVASEDTVTKRLLARGRPDDSEPVIRTRFEEYEKTTKPIVRAFKDAGIAVYDIDSDQPPNKVYQAILSALRRPVDAN